MCCSVLQFVAVARSSFHHIKQPKSTATHCNTCNTLPRLTPQFSLFHVFKVDIEALVQKYLELNPPKPRRSAAGAEDKGGGGGEGAEVVSEAEEEEAA